MAQDAQSVAHDRRPRTDIANLVPGLERGLRILAEFSLKEPVLAAPELSRRLGIPRTTVFRLLQTLELSGFLERAGREHYYRLGMSAQHLGFGFLKSLELTNHGLPLIERLRDRTDLTIHIVIRDEKDIVYIARAEGASSKLSDFRVNLGTRLPAHATIHGQILLGDLCFDELSTLYSGVKLQRFSENTPLTLDALYERVVAVTRRGYGVSESFFESGVSAISARVHSARKRVAAVVAATIPRPRIDEGRAGRSLVTEVLSTAGELSRRIDFDAATVGKYRDVAGASAFVR